MEREAGTCSFFSAKRDPSKLVLSSSLLPRSLLNNLTTLMCVALEATGGVQAPGAPPKGALFKSSWTDMHQLRVADVREVCTTTFLQAPQAILVDVWVFVRLSLLVMSASRRGGESSEPATLVRGTAVGERPQKTRGPRVCPPAKEECPTTASHLVRLSRGSITQATCIAREVSNITESIVGFGAVLIDHSGLSQKKKHHHPPPPRHTQRRSRGMMKRLGRRCQLEPSTWSSDDVDGRFSEEPERMQNGTRNEKNLVVSRRTFGTDVS